MININHEIYTFLCAVWIGCIVWGGYTVLRVLRKIIPHKTIWITIEDFVFWILSSLYIFMAVVRISEGVFRWYVLAAMLLGVIVIQIIWKRTEIIGKKIKKYLKNKV